MSTMRRIARLAAAAAFAALGGCAGYLRGAALQKQVSRAPCVQGRNWRWDAGGIWVKDGCRADFAVW